MSGKRFRLRLCMLLPEVLFLAIGVVSIGVFSFLRLKNFTKGEDE